jgi:hypothetical protein
MIRYTLSLCGDRPGLHEDPKGVYVRYDATLNEKRERAYDLLADLLGGTSMIGEEVETLEFSGSVRLNDERLDVGYLFDRLIERQRKET